MEKNVWYVLRQDCTLMRETQYLDGEGFDPRQSVFDFLPTNGRSVATQYPNQFHTERAIERYKKHDNCGGDYGLIPICFPS